MSKNTKAGMEQNKNKVSAAIAGGTLPLPEILAPLVGVHERTIRRYLEELEVNISTLRSGSAGHSRRSSG